MYYDKIGSGSPSLQASYGSSITIASQPSAHGFIFDGWSDGQGNILQPGNSYVITKPTVFTALWSPNTPI